MTDEEIDSLVKKYDIFEYWTEEVAKLPGTIAYDKIDDFVGKIQELQQKHSKIEIHAMSVGYYGSSCIQIMVLESKSRDDLIRAIEREIRSEEESRLESLGYDLEVLKAYQERHPELNITFTSIDDEE